MRITTFLVWIILFLPFSALAGEWYKFSHTNEKYGIFNREVTSMCEDNHGFIWIASKSHITRFSGKETKMYKLPLRKWDGAAINVCYYDRVYAYTISGDLFAFDTQCDSFRPVHALREMSGNDHLMLRNIYARKDSTYFFATSQGLYTVSHGQLEKPRDFSGYEIGDITIASDSTLFIESAGTVFRYNHYTRSVEKKYFLGNKFVQTTVEKLFYDTSHNRLLIGTYNKGIYYYDLKDVEKDAIQILQQFTSQPILAIEAINDDELLIGIDGAGLVCLNRQDLTFRHQYKEDIDNPSSLRGNGIYDILVDKHKRVWIATYSGGINQLISIEEPITILSHIRNKHNSLINNQVNAITEDQNHNIWFATEGGVSRWNPKLDIWRNIEYNFTHSCNAISCDHDGDVWVGTYGTGVYEFDTSTLTMHNHYTQSVNEYSLGNNFVSDILKDKQGNIWIGGSSGIFSKYNADQKLFIRQHYQPIIGFEERGNKIYLMCTYGLLVLDKVTNQTQTIYSGSFINDCYIGNQYIWLTTRGDGLIKLSLDGTLIKKIRVADGLPSDYINSVVADNHHLWLACENGLCRYNTQDENIEIISNMYNLNGIAFNAHSRVKLSSGEIIFGSNKGAVLISPSKIQFSLPENKLYIDNLYILGVSVFDSLSTVSIDYSLNSIKTLKLAHNQNSFSFSVKQIGIDDSRLLCRWQLNGFDTHRTPPSNEANISYTNIPYGKYILQIQLLDPGSNTLLDERSIEIEITPPFWKTFWAKLLIILAAVTLLFGIVKYYISLIEKRHSDEKLRFFINTAHDIRTPLTLIKAPLEELIRVKEHQPEGNEKYYIDLAINNTDRLTQMVEQLLDLQKSYRDNNQLIISEHKICELIDLKYNNFKTICEHKLLSLQLQNDIDPSSLIWGDISKTERILDNLLSNAVKYTQAGGTITLAVSLLDKYVQLKVIDTGIGIIKEDKQNIFKEFYRGHNSHDSQAYGAGIGLFSVKNYVEMMGGAIDFHSKENIGSEFVVHLPYKREDFPLNSIYISTSKEIFEYSSQIDSFSDEEKYLDTNILIVEDHDELREMITHGLENYFTVQNAKNGTLALEMIDSFQPDIIISDVMMPEMNGLELLEKLKNNITTSHLPVILLTALTDKKHILHGIHIGAHDYITKPFDIQILKAKITNVIKNIRTTQQLLMSSIERKTELPENSLLKEFDRQFVEQAVHIVNKYLNDPNLDKDLFASHMNVSPSLLYKKLKPLTGESPTDFIKRLRLNKSVELLTTSNISVGEISTLVGFSSTGYFCTVFKKQYGCSPKEYIQNKMKQKSEND